MRIQKCDGLDLTSTLADLLKNSTQSAMASS
jgi:hypothetical protein